MTIGTPNSASTLRLVWPQWQGAGAATVAELLPGVEIDRARRAYSVGTRVLQAVLPEHAGPTRVVPVDSDEVVLRLGKAPGGLTGTQVRRVIDDLSGAADVVGLTVAEFIPRSVLRLQTILAGLPLL
ncbi:hypothetical protein [Propionibacterium australiense]|uniref:Uncharacterized protein n=1 Tax=Propionibacterium australiense TaxID=119981 RepID=A0A383S875_9ACTN|nr:hypothetical protein [Propionibacterium australiense]RLP07512.1 hypothetical protein D9T14_10365 [Propionibacterium australiense]SYZ34117.1 Hypothetical protein PROPAUS_2119 [Propionibacterium australiense]VEH88706.1 Uncharacterised protein [Propionibacterium australiense]